MWSSICKKQIFSILSSCYTPPHDSGGVLWNHIGCPCVRPSVFSFLDDNLSKYQWCVHWYCRDLVWDCWWANFVNFWQSYLPATDLYFHFRMITLVNINGFSLNLVRALILWRSALGLLIDKFHKFLTELSARDTSVFSFLDDNFSENQWIFTKLAGLGGSVECASDWKPRGRGFDPRRGRQHSFVDIDHEIFSTVILSLPLSQEGQLSVSGERMCTILVSRLED